MIQLLKLLIDRVLELAVRARADLDVRDDSPLSHLGQHRLRNFRQQRAIQDVVDITRA